MSAKKKKKRMNSGVVVWDAIAIFLPRDSFCCICHSAVMHYTMLLFGGGWNLFSGGFFLLNLVAIDMLVKY